MRARRLRGALLLAALVRAAGAPAFGGWSSPVPGCDANATNALGTTPQGGVYPVLTLDTPACAAWKLAATVCVDEPTQLEDGVFNCSSSGGFGEYCAVPDQLVCSVCAGDCHAGCGFGAVTARNCSGEEVSVQARPPA